MFEKFSLDPRLAIRCIEFTDNAAQTTCIDVSTLSAADAIFIPPDPSVAFSSDVVPPAVKLLVQIEIRGSNRTATVSITKSGQVSVMTP